MEFETGNPTFPRIWIEQICDEYLDLGFVDASPKALRRIWWLSIDLNNPAKNYGFVRRSKTDESEFGDETMLPGKMVAYLVDVARKADEFPPKLKGLLA